MEHDLIEKYLTHLREIGRAELTITTRRQMLYRHHAELPEGLDAANEDELRSAIYRKDWSRRTQAANLAGIRSFFTWAERRGELDFNPAAALEHPKLDRGLPRPVEDSELADVLTRASDPYRLYALLAAGEGMRSCEIARADREDVTESGFRIFGKGGIERVVPTHPLVWQAVAPLPPGPLAQREDGTRATAHSVSGRTAAYFDDLGVPTITLHRLRHWFGTRALERCGNLRTVQELLGHTSPTSTAVYTQVSTQSRVEAVAGLPVLGEATLRTAA